ncbi:MAG: DUF4395 domain-containing protein [Actinomycetales bacterium]|jgi:hypothetical protein
MTDRNQLSLAAEFIPAPAAPVRSRIGRIFAFPNPVNEYAARSTAGIVVVLALAATLTMQGWALALIAAGFWLRLLFGPRISPAALLSTKVIAPRIATPKLVPGPPKRFAQGIGAALSTAAAICYVAGQGPVAWGLTALLIVAAALESVIGLCLGCLAFGRLQAWGLIPADVCEACNTVSFLK